MVKPLLCDQGNYSWPHTTGIKVKSPLNGLPSMICTSLPYLCSAGSSTGFCCECSSVAYPLGVDAPSTSYTPEVPSIRYFVGVASTSCL